MGKTFQLTEEERDSIKKLYLLEQSEEGHEDQKFCHAGNTKTLEEIMGDDEAEDYIDGIQLRKNGSTQIVIQQDPVNTLNGFGQTLNSIVSNSDTKVKLPKSSKLIDVESKGNNLSPNAV